MESPRTLEEISDGKIYDIDDCVAADTGGCKGCSACCHSVGDLVILTPFDVYEIASHLNQSLDELLENYIELREKNKIQLPHLKMQGTSERCSFLNSEGRCSIHGYRPNICRLFPLGRIYEQNTFKYFLQVGSCPKPKLETVQIREWIGIDNYEVNKEMIFIWHQFIKALTFRLKFVYDMAEIDKMNSYLIDTFYRIPLDSEVDFYAEFYKRLPIAKSELGIL
ncbi:MAG: YkgJ family cysteine cluster protein [Cellulosilyticum sp.]|nr:YkgJ family cysteine cluster protein [Cellulosilyticum sp.]